MSFDLFVLHHQVDSDIQAAWVDQLAKLGIDATLSPNSIVGQEDVSEIRVRCKLKPPIVNQVTEFNDHTISFHQNLIDEDDIKDYLDGAENDVLRKKISNMMYEIEISSGSGREDVGLILQCYLAATLADVTNGLLNDPQEFGIVQGDQVYEVAKHHCEYELNQLNISKKKKVKAQTLKHAKTEKKKKPVSGALIFILILLFVELINVLMGY